MSVPLPVFSILSIVKIRVLNNRRVLDVAKKKNSTQLRLWTTTDVIFAARHVMEKHRGWQNELHMVVIELGKAYGRDHGRTFRGSWGSRVFLKSVRASWKTRMRMHEHKLRPV